MSTYLAVDIGGTFTKYAVMNENADILRRGKIPTEKGSTKDFLDMLERIYRNYGAGTEGLAISSAGVIDSERGFLYNAGSIPCVRDLDLSGELERRIGIPVTVENDARSAALAEIWKGSLSDCENAVVLVIGTAVGGAVILNRRILHGKHQMAGEFSYLLTDAEHPADPMKTLAMTGGMPALIRLCSKETGISEKHLNGEIIFEKANQAAEPYLTCMTSSFMIRSGLRSAEASARSPFFCSSSGRKSTPSVVCIRIRFRFRKLQPAGSLMIPI